MVYAVLGRDPRALCAHDSTLGKYFISSLTVQKQPHCGLTDLVSITFLGHKRPEK